MAEARRAVMRLFAGLVVDFVCSLMTVMQLVPFPAGAALGVVVNVLQVLATTLIVTSLFCLRPLSRHFTASFRWQVARLVVCPALFVLAALPVSAPPSGPFSVRDSVATVTLTLATVTVSCVLSLIANREMLMGVHDSLGGLGPHGREQGRARSASTLVVASLSLLVASLLSLALALALLDVRTGPERGLLVLGGLVALACLAVAIVFVLVVDVLVIMRVRALGMAFAEVTG